MKVIEVNKISLYNKTKLYSDHITSLTVTKEGKQIFLLLTKAYGIVVLRSGP